MNLIFREPKNLIQCNQILILQLSLLRSKTLWQFISFKLSCGNRLSWKWIKILIDNFGSFGSQLLGLESCLSWTKKFSIWGLAHRSDRLMRFREFFQPYLMLVSDLVTTNVKASDTCSVDIHSDFSSLFFIFLNFTSFIFFNLIPFFI